MKAVTAAQMQQIDGHAINELGIPGAVLMAIAGKSISDYILSLEKKCRVVVIAGPGNNGGDGLVAAYYCHNAGLEVQVYLTAQIDSFTENALLYYNVCKNAHIVMCHIKDQGDVSLPHDADCVIIEALLGTGFKGKLRGYYPELIEKINASPCRVIAADIPGGLPSDGDAPEGPAVHADVTITMGLPKISLKTFPGMQYCGKVVVSDLGFPADYIDKQNIAVTLADESYFSQTFETVIDTYAHKNAHGHLVIIGGSRSMEGAAMLTAQGALETGAGLVTICTENASRPVIAGKIPEAMCFGYDPALEGADIVAFLSEKKISAVVFGPGLGRGAHTQYMLGSLIKLLEEQVIAQLLIDGDGLFALKQYREHNDLPQSVQKNIAVTPHFGEASYLTGMNSSALKKNHMQAANAVQKQTSAVTLLKGPGTVITDGIHCYINTTGTGAMATGGSGDVLSGICGALLARGYDALTALTLGAYIHGRAGELAADHLRKGLLRAGDITAYIPHALHQ